MLSGQFLELDELCLGFYLANGEDEIGNQIHITTIGFLIFSLELVIYKNNDN
jgi:hypothetical protein